MFVKLVCEIGALYEFHIGSLDDLPVQVKMQHGEGHTVIEVDLDRYELERTESGGYLLHRRKHK